jgi:hypothetical protein
MKDQPDSPRKRRTLLRLRNDKSEVEKQLDDQKTELDAIKNELAQLRQSLDGMRKHSDELHRLMMRVNHIVTSTHDNLPALRDKLLAVRKTNEYNQTFKDQKPLISIRIATYNRTDSLIQRTIPSIMAQTYKNWEVIIVGDHTHDDTDREIKKLNDPRIKFVNEPFQFPYPEDVLHRWMVAGAPAMNKATQMAAGKWIAPIDDDDEFTPDHLELLLKEALSGKYEAVFGKVVQHNLKTGQDQEIGSYPPQKSNTSAQGMIYMRLLNFFEYDLKSWAVEEVGDWNFIRRMMEAGVRMGAVDRVVGKLYYKPKF